MCCCQVGCHIHLQRVTKFKRLILFQEEMLATFTACSLHHARSHGVWSALVYFRDALPRLHTFCFCL